MKLKKLSFLAGAIALTLTAIPFAAEAQRNSEQPVVVAQGKKQGWWKKLNLTDEQKTEMQAIKESARAQMKEVLTEEQLQKLEDAKANGKKKREIYKELNLTDAQKAEMKKIKESKKSEMQAILTDEQKQQLQQMRQNFKKSSWQPPSTTD